MLRKPRNKNQLQSTLRMESFQELVEELNECKEQSLLGGSFAGRENIHVRFNADISPYEGCDPGTCC